MKYLSLLLAAVLAGTFLAGCDLAEDDDTSGIVTLEGQVLEDTATNDPVAGAFLRVLPFDLIYEADENGAFNFNLEIDSTMDVRLIASRDGYTTVSQTVLALAGRTINVPTFRLRKTASDVPVSGRGSNILLLSQSAQSIGVRESGSKEVAQVIFQVADSLGRPVVLKNAAQVRFTLGVAPNGGEFIFPETAQTDNNGRVSVNLSSGTRAGVVQIVAETEVGGVTLRSLPVSVTIHGGLPEQSHFSLGPAQFNFPGLRTYGLTNAVSVIVGDQYGNPVKQGTAVYFTTQAGVIEGSVQTNSQGRGSVNLISANPLPADGVGLITASTADRNKQMVSRQTAVVFSGVPVVTVSPTRAALNQTYRLTVHDPNGNPLAPGTAISVRVEGTRVKAVGNTNVRLDDTAFIGGLTYDHILRGPGITEFTFKAVEDLIFDEEGTPTVQTITILVSGPNGSIEIVLGDEAAPAAKTAAAEGLTVEKVDSETVRFKVNE